MPKIDQLVDATYRYPMMSFLDAFQGYHQIALAAEDQENTTFISLDANYHYTMMPFELENAEATYQRMITRMFQDKIGRTVKVYIDDMVVKSKHEARQIEDLRGGCSKYYDSISCDSIRISVPSKWGLASS